MTFFSPTIETQPETIREPVDDILKYVLTTLKDYTYPTVLLLYVFSKKSEK